MHSVSFQLDNGVYLEVAVEAWSIRKIEISPDEIELTLVNHEKFTHTYKVKNRIDFILEFLKWETYE